MKDNIIMRFEPLKKPQLEKITKRQKLMMKQWLKEYFISEEKTNE